MKVFALVSSETDWVVAEDETSARQEMVDLCGEEEFLDKEKVECKELSEKEMKETMLTDLSDDEVPQGEKSIWEFVHAEPDAELPYHLGGTAY
jgi:hypothetical protein